MDLAPKLDHNGCVDGEMLVSTESPNPRELPPTIPEDDDDGDRPSITEVNGTVARFEMAYSPLQGERFAFGPPLLQRLPAFIFLAISIAVAAIALYARFAPSNSALHVWIVEGDRNRPLGSGPLAVIILLSGVGTLLSSAMRGVVVTSDGVEARDVLVMGMPRVRKWTWPQIDRLVLDDNGVLLELWNGTYERLPRVAKGRELADLLSRVAAARGRTVTRLEPDA
jgi:hypothetical protein